MDKRLTLFTLGALIGLTLACSMTAPRAAVMAAHPTPQPSPPARPVKQTANRQLTAANVSARPTPAGVACIVTAQALYIRTCPGMSCAVIGWLAAGQAVTVDTTNPGGWANLTTGGWIYSSFINCKDKNHD